MAKEKAREHEAEGMHKKMEGRKHESMGMKKKMEHEKKDGHHKGMSKR